jgi:hypothetical protein
MSRRLRVCPAIVRHILMNILFTGVIAVSTAAAQVESPRGVVVQNAPIFLLADATRTPLRIAASGTNLEIVNVNGAWINVRFNDPEFGARVGYIEAKFVKVTPPSRLRPLDLSFPVAQPQTQAQRTEQTTDGERATDSPRQLSVPVPAQATHTRQGAWFNVGLGYGSFGCENCPGRADALSGGLSVGGTINQKLLLGVGTSGFYKSESGQWFSVSTLDARLRFYPMLASGFFVTGGMGLGSLRTAYDTDMGVGVILGLGWDIPVGSRVSLTPFWHGFAMRSSLVDANVGQLGLGVTIH